MVRSSFLFFYYLILYHRTYTNKHSFHSHFRSFFGEFLDPFGHFVWFVWPFFFHFDSVMIALSLSLSLSLSRRFRSAFIAATAATRRRISPSSNGRRRSAAGRWRRQLSGRHAAQRSSTPWTSRGSPLIELQNPTHTHTHTHTHPDAFKMADTHGTAPPLRLKIEQKKTNK